MISRISIWWWFAIILTLVYSFYNPVGFSLYHMWAGTENLDNVSFKTLLTVALLTVLGLIAYGTYQAITVYGLAVIVGIVGIVLWCVNEFVTLSVFSPTFFAWATQPIVAVILTIGWQWPKIWRSATGTVTTDDIDNHHHHA